MKILLGSSPGLRQKSREVTEDEFGKELDQHMDSMLEKMLLSNGVGLSGPQVGDHRCIIVADSGSGPLKAVNPKILDFSEEKITCTEGCLSLPGLRLDVERSKHITIEYKTPYGQRVGGTLSGINAVIFQHEFDHLNGITLLNMISNLKKGMYLKKLKKKIKARNKLIKEMKKLG